MKKTDTAQILPAGKNEFVALIQRGYSREIEHTDFSREIQRRVINSYLQLFK